MKGKSDKNFRIRLITSIIVISFTVLFFWLSDNEKFVRTVTAVLCVFAVYEMFNVTDTQEHEFWFVATLIAAFILPFVEIPYYGIVVGILFPIAIVWFFTMMLWQEYFRFGSPINAALLSLVVISFFKTLPEVRLMPNGLYYLIAPILICIVTDIFAYLIGRKWGKHKLAPTVSPKKTVEGSVAGVIAGVVFAAGLGLILQFAVDGISVRWWLFLLYAAFISVIGQFGDLSMSAIKRIANIKDFGALLPGHGGVLDRMDSHMLAITATYLFLVFHWTFF